MDNNTECNTSDEKMYSCFISQNIIKREIEDDDESTLQQPESKQPIVLKLCKVEPAIQTDSYSKFPESEINVQEPRRTRGKRKKQKIYNFQKIRIVETKSEHCDSNPSEFNEETSNEGEASQRSQSITPPRVTRQRKRARKSSLYSETDSEDEGTQSNLQGKYRYNFRNSKTDFEAETALMQEEYNTRKNKKRPIIIKPWKDKKDLQTQHCHLSDDSDTEVCLTASDNIELFTNEKTYNSLLATLIAKPHLRQKLLPMGECDYVPFTIDDCKTLIAATCGYRKNTSLSKLKSTLLADDQMRQIILEDSYRVQLEGRVISPPHCAESIIKNSVKERWKEFTQSNNVLNKKDIVGQVIKDVSRRKISDVRSGLNVKKLVEKTVDVFWNKQQIRTNMYENCQITGFQDLPDTEEGYLEVQEKCILPHLYPSMFLAYYRSIQADMWIAWSKSELRKMQAFFDRALEKRNRGADKNVECNNNSSAYLNNNITSFNQSEKDQFASINDENQTEVENSTISNYCSLSPESMPHSEEENITRQEETTSFETVTILPNSEIIVQRIGRRPTVKLENDKTLINEEREGEMPCREFETVKLQNISTNLLDGSFAEDDRDPLGDVEPVQTPPVQQTQRVQRGDKGLVARPGHDMDTMRRQLYLTQLAQSHKLYYEDTNKDVTFVVDNAIIKAHSCVIKKRCYVLHDVVLSYAGKSVKIQGVRVQVFIAFIKYLYLNVIDDMRNMADELIRLAGTYGMSCLKGKCEHYIVNTMGKHNAIDCLLKGYSVRSESIKKKALGILQSNLIEMTQSADFAKLQKYPALVQDILNSYCGW